MGRPPLVALGSAQYLSVFTVEPARALAFMFLRLYEQASNIGFTFFGLHVFLVGCLILKSTFLPRLVDALIVFGGVGWLKLSFTNLLSPPLARYLSPYVMVTSHPNCGGPFVANNRPFGAFQGQI